MTKKLSKNQLDTWRLFITAQSKLINKIDADLRDAGEIPLHWYDVLIELHTAQANRLRMNELADKVLLTRSGLTRLVDRLEKENFITRELDPEDRRGFYAIITAAGVTAMRQAWRVYSASISEYFAAYFDEEELAIFHRVLQRMLDE
jgi:DNA-binding MarR family transcriptional regulator